MSYRILKMNKIKRVNKKVINTQEFQIFIVIIFKGKKYIVIINMRQHLIQILKKYKLKKLQINQSIPTSNFK